MNKLVLDMSLYVCAFFYIFVNFVVVKSIAETLCDKRKKCQCMYSQKCTSRVQYRLWRCSEVLS